MNFEEFKEHSVKSGLGVILAYKNTDDTKYHIVCPLASIPAIAGSKNTIDYSTTSNGAITKIPGKKTTNDVEINFPWNADYVAIMDAISDITLDYAVIDLATGLGWKFKAEATYRMSDVDPENVFEGVLQLTVSSVEDKASDDMLSVYMDTITFENAINGDYDMGVSSSMTLNIVTDPATATITVESTNSAITAAYSNGVVTITSSASAATGYVIISATATDYAPASRKIYIKVK